MKTFKTKYGAVELTDKQIKNAKNQGLTLREAAELVAETRKDERADKQSYAKMTSEERKAHDNR